METLPHSITLEYTGKAGERTLLTHTPYCLFNVSEISASDMVPGEPDGLAGCRSRIGLIFVGNQIQGKCNNQVDYERLRSGFFSKNLSVDVLGVTGFSDRHPLIPFGISVEFIVECTIKVVLTGTAQKLADDTYESLHDRAVKDYEREYLARAPDITPENLGKFKEMLRSI